MMNFKIKWGEIPEDKNHEVGEDYNLKSSRLSTCWGGTTFKRSEVDGKCNKCNELTSYGNSISSCSYSRKICDECGHSPCDMSC